MKLVRFLAMLLMVIGAINWGLVGFFHYDLVERLLGAGMLARVVYGLVGLAGLYGIGMLCRCTGGGCSCGPNCGC
jgi:uncharacterized membrane protein YuzA (DUF378 family)